MGKPRKKTKGHTRACADKQRFDTLEAADKAAYRPGRRDFMQAYKCKKCGKYHYGHPSSPKQVMEFQ